MEDQSCKISRWALLKAQLNNLEPAAFEAALLESGENAYLIDVRTPTEFHSGHLPKAININYLSNDFWDRMESLSNDRDFFIYCRSGRRSIRACTLMKNGGFDHSRVFNMDGGLALWQEENRKEEG